MRIKKMAFQTAIHAFATKDDGHLFTQIAQCRVGKRPGRIEPRMRKRRPKSYPWLKIPRAQARHYWADSLPNHAKFECRGRNCRQ